MLNERFLSRLHDAFPSFYERVDEAAAADAARILRQTDGDVDRALFRARFESAGRLWWPYVKGTFGSERDAMEAFSRLVLTVDQIVGHHPGGMEAARAQVGRVLRESVDVERLRRLAARREGEATAGVVATATALLAPVGFVRKWTRWMPRSALIALGAVVVAALLSVPLVAGYSAGHQAERTARKEPALGVPA